MVLTVFISFGIVTFLMQTASMMSDLQEEKDDNDCLMSHALMAHLILEKLNCQVIFQLEKI